MNVEPLDRVIFREPVAMPKCMGKDGKTMVSPATTNIVERFPDAGNRLRSSEGRPYEIWYSDGWVTIQDPQSKDVEKYPISLVKQTTPSKPPSAKAHDWLLVAAGTLGLVLSWIDLRMGAPMVGLVLISGMTTALRRARQKP